MSQPVIIRDARREDYQAWLPLWTAYNAFYGRSGDKALAPEITRTTWSRFFDPYEPMRALIAERQGSLLGLAHFLLHRSTISVSPSIYLQDLFTVPDARGQGIARGLIEHIYSYAQRVGIARVYWQTHETNTNAMRLYDRVAERSGFILYRKNLDAPPPLSGDIEG